MSSTEKTLAERIQDTRNTDTETNTRIKSDQRVIARVTDGIYRQPASAIRELISNAYDADATEVSVDTDAPRFEKITITDDGSGMSPETLAYVLEHIGGSAKRTRLGTDLGVSSANPDYSPKGRKLIGKIGIGLFSVAQLSRTFQIITKVAGDSHRTVAAITLKAYSDESLDDDEYESGVVRIWSEAANDIASRGTTIIIANLHPQAKNTLRSLDTWLAVDGAKDTSDPIDPPTYHIGKVDIENGETMTDTPELPYNESHNSSEKFIALMECVWNHSSGATSTPNLKLEQFFDYYLNMIWSIGLSIPANYVDLHPFEITGNNEIQTFKLSNDLKRGSTAEEIKLNTKQSLREKLNLDTPTVNDFSVTIDNIEINRPLQFTKTPLTKNILKTPLIFIGKCEQNFSGIDKELSSGDLVFEAYLLWAPKISPRDHRGALIRINGASGTLFDESFLKYQVAEMTRLNQITCEIFVSKGLDSALNIDRESFNSSHPHFIYLTTWLHGALRQLATSQKKLATAKRKITREISTESTISKIHKISEAQWEKATNGNGITPDIVFEDIDISSREKISADTYVFPKEIISPFKAHSNTVNAKKEQKIAEERLKGITQVLSSYGLLDNLTAKKQKNLLLAIASILAATDGD